MIAMNKRFITILLLLLCLGSMGCGRSDAQGLQENKRLARGVTIDGLDVSGMRVYEARAALADAHKRQACNARYTLTYGSGSLTLTGSDLGAAANAEGALTAAAKRKGRGEPAALFSSWRADGEAVQSAAARVSQLARQEPESASVSLDFSRSTPFVYKAERPGARVDTERLCALLHAAVKSGKGAEIAVPLLTIEPAHTVSDVSKARQLIASYTTSFSKRPYSDADRVFNIKKAAAAIHGTVLLPDAEFDTNAVLGDRNEQNGWREAAGIRNGTYVQEYGGGVCQVSSTLFNAVMLADLTVTERHAHSWPMGYVDIGRDATISTGGKNFRFVNSTASELYLCAVVDADAQTVTVSIYGRPLPDGQYIEVSSEKTGSLELPADEWMLDESLPAGTSFTAREARQGKTSRTYKAYYAADGTLISRVLAYEDVYRSIPGLVYMSADLFYS